MGVVNVTPDSFSDGGVNFDAADAVASARRMAADGAALVDVGGESTRPGSEGVSAEEELRRVLPVLEAIAGEVIARIDDGDYRLAVASARDKVATQQATVERFDRQIVAQQAAVEQTKAQLTGELERLG